MTGPILLFDGECGFCSHAVRFVAEHDRTERIRFAPLQSDVGRRLLDRHGLPQDLSTVVFIDEGGRASTRSSAAAAVAAHFAPAWRWLRWIVVLPRGLRDAAYDYVAARRAAIAGQACGLPSPALRARMLDRA